MDQLGQDAVNSVFLFSDQLCVAGITGTDNSDMPENSELTLTLTAEGISTLQLRCNDADLFASLAGCCIQAVTPDILEIADAMKGPQSYAGRVKESRGTSFEEPVMNMRGTMPRMYYAYYPNQYKDGNDWLQLTIVFPLEGMPEQTAAPTEAVSERNRAASSESGDYDGYDYDGGDHYDVYVTETPEPANDLWNLR